MCVGLMQMNLCNLKLCLTVAIIVGVGVFFPIFSGSTHQYTIQFWLAQIKLIKVLSTVPTFQIQIYAGMEI
jgi:hypothetical protein